MSITSKLHLFVGSSKEGLDIARAVQSELFHDFHTTLWSQGFFKPNSSTLNTLCEKARSFDGAIFILSGDDRTASRDIESMSIRDNVLFEFGLFLGSLGPRRVFFLVDVNDSRRPKLPSDLDGVTPIPFDSSHPEALGVVGHACSTIRGALRSLDKHISASQDSEPKIEKNADFHWAAKYIRQGEELYNIKNIDVSRYLGLCQAWLASIKVAVQINEPLLVLNLREIKTLFGNSIIEYQNTILTNVAILQSIVDNRTRGR